MFYGIEQSTDLRSPRTVVKKFVAESSLLYWLSHSVGFTHSDPDAYRNHHHSFRHGYQLHGAVNKKDLIFKESGTRDYPRIAADNLARYVRKYGSPLWKGNNRENNGDV